MSPAGGRGSNALVGARPRVYLADGKSIWWEENESYLPGHGGWSNVEEPLGRGALLLLCVCPNRKYDADLCCMTYNGFDTRLGNQKVTFQIASLDDREVVAEDDELLIITCPDPPSLKKTVAICEKAAEMVGMPTPPLTFYSAVCAPPVTLPTLTNVTLIDQKCPRQSGCRANRSVARL
eukprot:1175817-Prorocentrum_minimum.AAC.5